MSKIVEISGKVKAKLEGIESIAFVNDTIEPRNEGFPCVQFEPSSLDSTVNDTCTNLRELKFELVLIQEIESIPTVGNETKRKAALTIIENVYGTIIDEFDRDYTLTGSCEGGVAPVNATFGEANLETGNLLFVRFELNCRYIFNINI